MEESTLNRKTIRDAISDRQENLRLERLESEQAKRKQDRKLRSEQRQMLRVQQERARHQQDQLKFKDLSQRVLEDTESAIRHLRRAVRALQNVPISRHSEEGKNTARMVRLLNDALRAASQVGKISSSGKNSDSSDQDIF